jgi:cytidylate kinase
MDAELSEEPVRVITIDGPSGAGKGTVAQAVASVLGFHLLDSGAIYRSAAIHALENGVDLASEDSVLDILTTFEPRFGPGELGSGVQAWLGQKNITAQLRNEETASAASKIASMPQVREALLASQRDFQRAPGLVADGRDMGTVVFPDAFLKVFLTASVNERAIRRAKQLKEQGITTTMQRLTQDIQDRDTRDSTRSAAPLVAAADALSIDSSNLGVDEVVWQILSEWDSRIKA